MSMKYGVGDDPFADEPDEEEDEIGEEAIEEAAVGGDDIEVDRTRVDVLADLLEEIEDGDRGNQVAFRDRTMVALGAAIDENDGLRQALAADLTVALDREIDADDLDRSELARLLIRAGLQDVAPDVWDDLGDAQAKLARQSL